MRIGRMGDRRLESMRRDHETACSVHVECAPLRPRLMNTWHTDLMGNAHGNACESMSM